MMDMCTALRRVRGTLLRRGPWVMEGQLLLGTSPALQRQTRAEEREREPERAATGALADFMASTLSSCSSGGLNNSQMQNFFVGKLYLCISGGSRLILALSSITSFATRPLL